LTGVLSIASVVEDGHFSDFSGYERTLILVKGNGISLQQAGKRKDKLSNLLDVATFDGGLKFSGTLHSRPINDFNFIADKEKYKVTVHTYDKKIEIILRLTYLIFMYCLSGDANISSSDGTDNINLKHGCLIKITQPSQNLTISRQQPIVANLNLN
jgi:environmental stress-induced protein Ves